MSAISSLKRSKVFTVGICVTILALGYWKFGMESYTHIESIVCYDDKDNVARMNTGNPAIVSFYQTWCSDCRRETPMLDSFAKSQGIDLYLISDEPMEKIEKFRALFPTVSAFHSSKRSMKDMGIRKFPTVYFYDSKGHVLFKKLEVVDHQDLENYLAKIK
jgi:thiol-disulfide isomerase/thioredoxin